jgi:hypothetical protein
VADACDRIIAEHKGDLPAKIKGSHIEGLPPLLRDLDTDYVTVTTNAVVLLMGGAVEGYKIIWGAREEGSDLWELTVYREAPGNRVVFSRRKAAE